MIGFDKFRKFSIAAILFISNMPDGHAMIGNEFANPIPKKNLSACMQQSIDQVWKNNAQLNDTTNGHNLTKPRGRLVLTYKGNNEFNHFDSPAKNSVVSNVGKIKDQITENRSHNLGVLNVVTTVDIPRKSEDRLPTTRRQKVQTTSILNAVTTMDNSTKSGFSFFETCEEINTSYCFNLESVHLVNSHIEMELDRLEKKNHKNERALKDVTNADIPRKSEDRLPTTRRQKVQTTSILNAVTTMDNSTKSGFSLFETCEEINTSY